MSDSIIFKRCSKKELCCHPEQKDGGWLPATHQYFYFRKNGKIVLPCKECAKKNAMDWHHDNKKYANQRSLSYYKEHKEYLDQKGKEWRERNKDKIAAKARIRWKNREHEKTRKQNNEASLRYYYRNHQKAKSIRRNWKRRNRITVRAMENNRRAKEVAAEGKFTKRDIEKIFKSQKGKCYYCDVKLKRGYHVDHVIPLGRGGSNYPSNLVCACPKCNLSKNDKTLREWMEVIRDPILSLKVAQRIVERERQQFLTSWNQE